MAPKRAPKRPLSPLLPEATALNQPQPPAVFHIPPPPPSLGLPPPAKKPRASGSVPQTSTSPGLYAVSPSAEPAPDTAVIAAKRAKRPPVHLSDTTKAAIVRAFFNKEKTLEQLALEHNYERESLRTSIYKWRKLDAPATPKPALAGPATEKSGEIEATSDREDDEDISLVDNNRKQLAFTEEAKMQIIREIDEGALYSVVATKWGFAKTSSLRSQVGRWRKTLEKRGHLGRETKIPIQDKQKLVGLALDKTTTAVHTLAEELKMHISSGYARQLVHDAVAAQDLERRAVIEKEKQQRWAECGFVPPPPLPVVEQAFPNSVEEASKMVFRPRDTDDGSHLLFISVLPLPLFSGTSKAKTVSVLMLLDATDGSLSPALVAPHVLYPELTQFFNDNVVKKYPRKSTLVFHTWPDPEALRWNERPIPRNVTMLLDAKQYEIVYLDNETGVLDPLTRLWEGDDPFGLAAAASRKAKGDDNALTYLAEDISNLFAEFKKTDIDRAVQDCASLVCQESPRKHRRADARRIPWGHPDPSSTFHPASFAYKTEPSRSRVRTI